MMLMRFASHVLLHFSLFACFVAVVVVVIVVVVFMSAITVKERGL